MNFPDDTPQRVAAREILENGGGWTDAARTAEVHPHTVRTWAARWTEAGWVRPSRADGREQAELIAQAAPAQEASQVRWADHRERVGLTAGLLAGQALRRIDQLLPRAGIPETVVEQAVDEEGRPKGMPRTKVIVPVPSVEVYRLAATAEILMRMADRSIGLVDGGRAAFQGDDGDLPAVPSMPDIDTALERRREVIDILARVRELPVSGETPDGRSE